MEAARGEQFVGIATDNRSWGSGEELRRLPVAGATASDENFRVYRRDLMVQHWTWRGRSLRTPPGSTALEITF